MTSHEKLKQYFLKINDTLRNSVGCFSDKELPFDGKSGLDGEWINRFYTNPIYRHVHLEYYKTNKISVLHSNAFPNCFVNAPIMGFDVISIGEKITGLFFDLTPIDELDYVLNSFLKDLKKDFKSPQRPLPEWATFFSNNFYCISPLEEELDNIIDRINDTIKYYLEYVSVNNSQHKKIIQKQNEYCIGQKKNNKTFNALAAEIGKDNAELFLNKYLFPQIDLHVH